MSCLSDLFAQVVNMEFEGGLTAAFSMVAFTEEICKRKTTIYGSKVRKKKVKIFKNYFKEKNHVMIKNYGQVYTAVLCAASFI